MFSVLNWDLGVGFFWVVSGQVSLVLHGGVAWAPTLDQRPPLLCVKSWGLQTHLLLCSCWSHNPQAPSDRLAEWSEEVGLDGSRRAYTSLTPAIVSSLPEPEHCIKYHCAPKDRMVAAGRPEHPTPTWNGHLGSTPTMLLGYLLWCLLPAAVSHLLPGVCGAPTPITQTGLPCCLMRVPAVHCHARCPSFLMLAGRMAVLLTTK